MRVLVFPVCHNSLDYNGYNIVKATDRFFFLAAILLLSALAAVAVLINKLPLYLNSLLLFSVVFKNGNSKCKES